MTCELDLVVLGTGRAVETSACRALLALPADAGAPLLLVWRGSGSPGVPRVPATPAARALAAALTGRDLAAVASGRLVRCTLPDDAAAACVAAQRALAAARGPVAAAICGPRTPELEPLVAGADRVLVAAAASPALAACAVAEFGARAGAAPASSRVTDLLAFAGLGRPATRGRREDGQALVLVLAALVVTIVAAAALALLASGLRERGDHQRAADLAALAGARALLDLRPRALGPVDRTHTGAERLATAEYLSRARAVALQTGRRNGAERIDVAFSGGGLPDRVRVVVEDPIRVAGLGDIALRTVAEAELTAYPVTDAAGEYAGPLAVRDGKPMRPDVALAYDRMARGARDGGHALVVVSGFRSRREQERLWAAHPDPRWVAPPGQSLHRLGTELDLGPASAYGWLAANAGRFGFVQRYAWEPWHYGLQSGAGSASLGYGASGVPAFVPVAYQAAIRDAAIRHQVGAALLAAQISQESGFDPRARSPAGALGIAQFMPATASLYGLADAFDPAQAINAQARLMHDLLRRFGAVPLALAAYNAGAGAVAACGCIPAITETQAYVARILALLGTPAAGAGGPPVRLIL